jgi:Flagellar basal body L-ring protein
MKTDTRVKNRPMTRRERELLVRCVILMAGVIFFSMLAAVRARAGDYYGQRGYDDRYDVMSDDDHDFAYRLRGKVVGNRPVYFRQKASRQHDSVTIVINEDTSSEITSSNDLKRDTSNNFTLTNWLTPKLSGGLGTTQHGQAVGGNTPTMAWSGSRAHKSDSSIDRSQKFTSTLTGKVLSVLTNGYLVIEARKTVNVNGEIQEVTVTGTVNPDHMDSNSAVRAEQIMDMEVTFTGSGPMTRMDKRGWWAKAWDFLTPF